MAEAWQPLTTAPLGEWALLWSGGGMFIGNVQVDCVLRDAGGAVARESVSHWRPLPPPPEETPHQNHPNG